MYVYSDQSTEIEVRGSNCNLCVEIQNRVTQMGQCKYY